MHAAGQRIAEAQSRKGRHNKVKGLVGVWVIRIGKDIGDMAKGQVGERKWWYQEQRHRVRMARPRMDEVHPRRGFCGGCLDADSELGNRFIDFTFMIPPGEVLKPKVNERLQRGFRIPPCFGIRVGHLARKPS